MEPLAAFDDWHAELLFELTDAAGECRLCDVAGLRRPREMLFTRQRDKILELADVHGALMLVNFQLPTANSQEIHEKVRNEIFSGS